MANDIHIIRLNTGELVVGRVKRETVDDNGDKVVIVQKPAIVFTQKGPHGETQVALAPFAPMSKSENVPIYKSCIQFNVEAEEQITANYIKATSNLDVPTTPKLILES